MDFEYTIANKPCSYDGVVFRSRLEAHWAAFFNSLGVSWEYEPTQMQGWIPDFLIENRWYAEVKPLQFSEISLFHHFKKKYQSALNGEKTVLFLGKNPWNIELPGSYHMPILGVEYNGDRHFPLIIDFYTKNILPYADFVNIGSDRHDDFKMDFTNTIKTRWNHCKPIYSDLSTFTYNNLQREG